MPRRPALGSRLRRQTDCLRRPRRPPPAALPQVARLSAAAPLWPIADARTPGPADVPLVWTSPEQPNTARFYVEVYRIDRNVPTLVNAAFAPRSAMTLRLEPGAYAWRVICSDAASQRYVPSGWASFQVAPVAPDDLTSSVRTPG